MYPTQETGNKHFLTGGRNAEIMVVKIILLTINVNNPFTVKLRLSAPLKQAPPSNKGPP